MSYANFESMFVDAAGAPKAGVLVPESCIDSAEFIIRRIATKGSRLTRTNTGPNMMAKFGNMEFNASTEDFVNRRGPQDYPFAGLPDIGQGIILLNKTRTDLSYNMHLGAIVAKDARIAVISHMFQMVRSYTQEELKVMEITSVDDFRNQTFGGRARLYAVGLLFPELAVGGVEPRYNLRPRRAGAGQ